MKIYKTIGFWILGALALVPAHAQNEPGDWRWQGTHRNSQPLYIGADTIAQPGGTLTGHPDWWKPFGYPALDSLIGLAGAHNADLKAAASRVEQARARRRIALSSMFPDIALEAGYLRQGLSANRPNPFGGELNAVTFNTFHLPLTVSYELDVFGKNNDLVRASTLLSEATEEQRKYLMLQVFTEVAQNFFLILQLDAENELLRTTEVTRQDNLSITSARYEAGLVSQIDVLRAKTELSSVQVQLKTNAQLRAEIELTLAVLVGKDASEFSIPPLQITHLPPAVILFEKDSLTGNRPDLRSAKLVLESNEKLVNSQKKELLPAISFQGEYGYLSGESADLTQSSSKNWLLGFNASLPIFQGGRKRSEIALRKKELEESEALYEQAVLSSYSQVENAYARLKWVHDQLLSQQEFVSAASEAAQLTKERYRKGLVNYIDVVDADRQVLEAEQLSVQLFGQELIGRVGLIQALGIGSQTTF